MRYVILGGGSVTAEYYLPAMARMGRLGDVTVVEPTAGSLSALRSSWPGLACRDVDYRGFFETLETASAEAPAIIVALPNHLHVDAVRMALERECNVLCEKPLALDVRDCAELRELASRQRALLKVAMSRRYLPSLMLARDIVRAGELGPVRRVEVHDCGPFLWRPRSFAFFARESGGVLADMGVHYLDWLDTLVGPMTPVSYSDDARGGTESSLCYRLAAGEIGIELRLSRLDPSGAHVKILCERGEILVDKSDETRVTVSASGSRPRRISLEQPFDCKEWPASFHGSFCQMLADFERALAGRPTAIADVTDAERAVALIAWAYDRRNVTGAKAAAPPAAPIPRAKVAVTGATGFIGGHLVARLSDGPNDLRLAVRSPGSCANVARFAVDLVPTDLLDSNSVQRLVAGARTVFHLAYGADGQASITIDGTKNVVNAAIAAQADCVVVLSTMYVFGFPATGRAVDESFPYQPYGGEYGSSKASMERWCLERARTSGRTRIVVLNPTCVFGPGGGAYTSLPVSLARAGQFCWISGGAGIANYTYVDNTVDAILAAAAVPAAHGERFIVSDGSVTWRELIEPMLGDLARVVPSYTPEELERLPRFGGPFRFKELVSAAISAPEVRAVAKRSPAVRRVFGMAKQLGQPHPRPTECSPATRAESTAYPPAWLASLFAPTRAVFSAEKARRVLGWTPRVPLAEAQDRTMAWLTETGRLPAAAWRGVRGDAA